MAIESRWPFNQLGPVASIRFDDPACRPLRESFERARLFERIDLRSDDRDKSEFVNVLVNFKKRSGATHYFAYAEKPRKRDGAVAYSGVFERTPVFFEGDFPRVIRSMKRRGVLKFAYTCC